MKTLITFALAGLLATSAFAVDAEDLKANSSVHTNYKKISVHLNEGVGKAKIAIYDMNGKKLHQRSVKANEDLRVPYDLNSLPTGKYQVFISTDAEEVMYTVETVEEEKPTPALLPLMAYGKKVDHYTVNLLVVGLDQAGTEVKIKRIADDRVVHEETVEQAEGFRKNYRLNGLDAEEVYMEVTDTQGRSRTIYF
ncbi:copper resistance protein CopC [Algoriphagus sp.]|uniref:copper resistance protein CopC n=1 Tax=Algoriphagus sp. TaxID=1872435 RepID=UPI00327D1098